MFNSTIYGEGVIRCDMFCYSGEDHTIIMAKGLTKFFPVQFV